MPHLYYSVLANLSDAPGHQMRMTDLAEVLKITRSRLTYVVTRLEKDGTVRREGCSTDKRGSMAVLTDAGLALLERTAPGHVETVRAAVFDHLTPEQVGQLEAICTRITEAVQGNEERSACGGLPWRRRSSTG
jgi:DNA-binding MarR family transcriptional regulator